MKPFTTIRIARWGRYETRAGTISVLRTDAPKIVRASGKSVLIDLDFGAAHEDTLQGFFHLAMGLCRIAARSDGLYADSIEWKAEAVAYLEAGKFAYLVPAFELTTARRPRRVIGLALTNTAVDGFQRMRDLLPEPLLDAKESER